MDGFGNCLLLLQAQIEAPRTHGWLIVCVLAVIFIVPFILGQLIGAALRLRDLSGQIGVVLMSVFMALAPFVYQEIVGRLDEARVLAERAQAIKDGKAKAEDFEKIPYRRRTWRDAVHWGIDLAGGTNLVYAIDLQAARDQGKEVDKATVDKMVTAIAKRLNPSGAEELELRRVGSDRIEVIIPGADPDLVKQKKALITKLGSLEFGIVANVHDHHGLIDKALKLGPKTNELRSQTGEVIAAWHDLADFKDEEQFRSGRVGFRTVPGTDPKTGTEIQVPQVLIKHDSKERAVTGSYLTNARSTTDQDGGLAVSFTFNSRGAALFSKLTGDNLPDPTDKTERQLAILLDGKVQSAPNIKSRISGSGQITGRFTKQEIDELVGVLNAGALAIPLIQTPVSEFTISPLLGIDVQKKGITAIVVSAVSVFVFMLIYYMIAGLVADFCLTLNLTLVVGSMAFISATFTLPGLAGLVLTIGMAVDSNVLIYERMREELARGASLRLAIQNGFDKAFAAIIDGHVTTLITAVILYLIGTDLIRGFAVSLFIGLTVSLFSCLYFGHLCFNIIERKRWVKTLKMLQFLGETKIDFLRNRTLAYVFSGTLIGTGLVTLVVRGSQNMDIDFSGGTMVTFEFVDSQKSGDVRSRLEAVFPDGVSLERLTLAKEEVNAAGGRRFRIRITEQDQKVVSRKINEAFNDPGFALVRVTLDEISVGPIVGKLEGDAARFEGGHEASLKFNGAMSEATVVDYVVKELSGLKIGKEQNKYDSLQLFLSATGTKAAKAEEHVAQSSPKYTEFNLRASKQIDVNDLTSALNVIQSKLATEPLFEEVNVFETSVANETKLFALLAIMASMVMIVVYIWFRFEKVYFGFASIAALTHDVLVTLGCIAMGAYLSKTPIGSLLLLEDFKINTGQVACLLTIVGYALNDTIVIFDRIREIKGKGQRITYDMINLSVNQTLSRTILTALTVFIVVVVLYLFGGSGIHGFAFSMIIGVLASAYSTIYIANPVLFWLVEREFQSHPKKAVA